MKKKILSMVTIAALAFSTMSTFMVANAETAKPTIQYVFDFVDNGATFDDSYDAFWDYEDLEGAPVYDITLTITGFTKKASVKEGGTTVAYTGAIIDGIEGVAAELETSKEYIILAQTKNWTSGTALVGSDIAKNKIAYSWGAASSSEALKNPDTVLATWTIMVTDGSEITDLKISKHEDANLVTRFLEVYDGTDKVGEKSVYATSNVFVGYGEVEEPAGPTTDVVDTTKVDNAELSGDEFLIEDSEAAVAYISGEYNFKSGQTAFWTAKFDGADKKKDVNIANVSGSAKLGIVITGATNVTEVKLNVVTPAAN